MARQAQRFPLSHRDRDIVHAGRDVATSRWIMEGGRRARSRLERSSIRFGPAPDRFAPRRTPAQQRNAPAGSQNPE